MLKQSTTTTNKKNATIKCLSNCLTHLSHVVHLKIVQVDTLSWWKMTPDKKIHIPKMVQSFLQHNFNSRMKSGINKSALNIVDVRECRLCREFFLISTLSNVLKKVHTTAHLATAKEKKKTYSLLHTTKPKWMIKCMNFVVVIKKNATHIHAHIHTLVCCVFHEI